MTTEEAVKRVLQCSAFPASWDGQEAERVSEELAGQVASILPALLADFKNGETCEVVKVKPTNNGSIYIRFNIDVSVGESGWVEMIFRHGYDEICDRCVIVHTYAEKKFGERNMGSWITDSEAIE